MKRTDQGRKDLKSKKPVAFDFVGVCFCLCFAAPPPMSTLTGEKTKRRKEEDPRVEGAEKADMRSEERI